MLKRSVAVVRLVALSLGVLGVTASVRAAPAVDDGVVQGTVRLDVAGEADPPMLSPYARRRYRPPTPAPAAPGSPVNVVVYVIADGDAPPPAPDSAVAITQRDRTILPHVTAVQAGTRIEFPNQDEVFHNLFSLSDAHAFNLGRYPPGDSRSETFPEPGVVRMFCDIHSEMGGVILVLDTPWFARPDESGRYRIEGVPAGRRRVVAWHESAGADTVEVDVDDGGVVSVDFRLPR
jgi:plastocyanin